MELSSVLSTEFWRDALELVGIKVWAVVKVLIFFLVVRAIAYRLIDRLLKSITERQTGGGTSTTGGRLRTLCSLVKSIIFYVLIFISGVMILRVFDVDPAPVLTAAGVVGLAVGFGAQKLVRDIIAGFFTILENQYSVGEYVTIGAITGTVQELGMRITQLRDDMGKLVIIANGDIVQVINHSRGPIQATLEVSVAADSDPEKVRAAIDSAGAEVAARVEGVVTPPTAGGIIGLDSCKTTFRVAGEVRSGRQDAVQTALREAILRKFAELEIRLA